MNKHLVELNLSVILFSLAGLFAKWITIPTIMITLGRVFFSSIALLIFRKVKHENEIHHSKADLGLFIISGIILAMHWFTFLQSIRLSTVAIGTITFSSFPLFVVLLEPLVDHHSLNMKDVIKAIFVLIGVLVISPFTFESSYSSGFIVGMTSSILYAILTLINKHFSTNYQSSTITFYEQSIACIVLLPVLLNNSLMIGYKNLLLLIVLGVIMTAFAHTLFVDSLKGVRASIASIISSGEGAYSIIFALLFLHEIPSINEIIGLLIILITIIASEIKVEA